MLGVDRVDYEGMTAGERQKRYYFEDRLAISPYLEAVGSPD